MPIIPMHPKRIHITTSQSVSSRIQSRPVKEPKEENATLLWSWPSKLMTTTHHEDDIRIYKAYLPVDRLLWSNLLGNKLIFPRPYVTKTTTTTISKDVEITYPICFLSRGFSLSFSSLFHHVILTSEMSPKRQSSKPKTRSATFFRCLI